MNAWLLGRYQISKLSMPVDTHDKVSSQRVAGTSHLSEDLNLAKSRATRGLWADGTAAARKKEARAKATAVGRCNLQTSEPSRTKHSRLKGFAPEEHGTRMHEI
jgi:hypothetical protein